MLRLNPSGEPFRLSNSRVGREFDSHLRHQIYLDFPKVLGVGRETF